MPDHASSDRPPDRPAVAIVTNHGYAGVDLPTGGAPDTGGQNIYVNNFARALDTLGYRVTIFTRGGFPGYDSDNTRDEPEHLTPNVRYVFVKGGGDEFIRKEDIAIALDEQVEWLEAFVAREAREQGVEPWEQYEFWSTHYWDAAVMTTRLIERWRNEIAARTIAEISQGIAPDKAIKALRDHRHTRAVGADPAHALGKLLLDAHAAPNATLSDTLPRAAGAVIDTRSIPKDVAGAIHEFLGSELTHAQEHVHHAIQHTRMAQYLGEAVLETLTEPFERMVDAFALADRHCWTPHSLGELKDANYKDRPVEVRRDLKFCERRNHERMVCDRTPAFASTSPEISERLCTQYGVDPERVAFFPPGLDTEVFRVYEDHELKPTWRYLEKKTGLSRDDIRNGRVVFEASRMDETKRKDLLLDAFEKVARDHDDTYCFITGGPEHEVLERIRSAPATRSTAAPSPSAPSPTSTWARSSPSPTCTPPPRRWRASACPPRRRRPPTPPSSAQISCRTARSSRPATRSFFPPATPTRWPTPSRGCSKTSKSENNAPTASKPAPNGSNGKPPPPI